MTPEDVAVAIGRHDQRLIVTEKGIANFRDFQAVAREFYSEYRAVRKEREEAEKSAAALAESEKREREKAKSNRIAIASILAVVMLPPAGLVGARVTKAAGDMYQMLQEWESTHKAEINQKKSTGYTDPSYYMTNSHQHAGDFEPRNP